MFGLEELKDEIEITQTKVECPVKGCSEKVERQRKTFKREDRFKCPEHRIYISPSTFEYQSEEDNLLWKQKADMDLLGKIRRVKRESRMARDNSEDAVTWNVFRFLERNTMVSGLFAKMVNSSVKNPEVIYWSYYQKQNGSWSELNKARQEFGERLKRGSEPDIIIKCDNTVFFIEAKLTAGNETVPSGTSSTKKYETGGDNWYSKVFRSDYTTIPRREKKYELLRFWLLGTWMAKQMDSDFYLINLVLFEREVDIEAAFGQYIKQNQRRKFLRVAWENICQYISHASLSKDKDIIMRFFRNKSIGYDTNAQLQRAFSVSHLVTSNNR